MGMKLPSYMSSFAKRAARNPTYIAYLTFIVFFILIINTLALF